MNLDKDFVPQRVDEINIRQIINKYTRNWPLFLASLAIFVTIGFIYLRYQIPEYIATARILIKDEKSGQSILNQESIFKDLGLFSGEKNIDNEIEILKSRSLMISVVKSLKANIIYYSYGRPIYHERFDDSPIVVKCIVNDTLKYENYKGNWEVLPLSNSKFSLIDIEKKESIGEYEFDKEILVDCGKLVFSKTRFYNASLANKTFKIKILPIETAANMFLSNLSVSPVNKMGSVLAITIKCTVPKKGISIINGLISTREMIELEDRATVSNNTAKFISERIKYISEELGDVETEVEQYKRANKLTDITSEANLYLQSGSESEKKLIELGSELKIIEFMMTELKTQNTMNNLIPANLGLKDESIAGLIGSYNKAALDHKRLTKNAGEKNPLIENNEKLLNELKKNIFESLTNNKKALEINIKDIKAKEDANMSRIASVPKFEREFRNIFRQQQIKETLYLFLLQKREETNISLSGEVSNSKTIDEAYSSGDKVWPNPRVIYTIMLFLAIIIPLIIIFLRELLDSKINGRADLESYNVPILGEIPFIDEPNFLITKNDKSIYAEYFRLLRTNLSFMTESSDNKSKVILITSTISREGKTFISMNLASSFALSEKRTLLIGMDLRHPKIAGYLNIKDIKGVTNFVIDNTDNPSEYIIDNKQTGLLFDILLSGPIPPNPSELLLSKKIDRIIEYAKATYDVIILDTSPIGLVADSFLLSKYADCSIYLVRAKHVEKSMLNLINDIQSNKRFNHLAFLLNGVDMRKQGYGYSYGYGYGYTEQKETEGLFKKIGKKIKI